MQAIPLYTLSLYTNKDKVPNCGILIMLSPLTWPIYRCMMITEYCFPAGNDWRQACDQDRPVAGDRHFQTSHSKKQGRLHPIFCFCRDGAVLSVTVMPALYARENFRTAQCRLESQTASDFIRPYCRDNQTVAAGLHQTHARFADVITKKDDS